MNAASVGTAEVRRTACTWIPMATWIREYLWYGVIYDLGAYRLKPTIRHYQSWPAATRFIAWSTHLWQRASKPAEIPICCPCMTRAFAIPFSLLRDSINYHVTNLVRSTGVPSPMAMFSQTPWSRWRWNNWLNYELRFTPNHVRSIHRPLSHGIEMHLWVLFESRLPYLHLAESYPYGPRYLRDLVST